MSTPKIIKILNGFFFSQLLIANCLTAQQYGHWEIIDSTILPHQNHASVVMNSDNIMVACGQTGYATPYSSSAEIYNVISNTWNMKDSMNDARSEHSLVLLQDNRILAVGGSELNSCEIYDPISKM